MIQDILRVMKLEGSKVQNNLELPRKKKKITSSLFSSGSSTKMALENLYPNMFSIILDI